MGFNCFNTIANVTADKKNNVIKVTSTWYNRAISTNPTVSRQTTTVTYTIPDKFYDITTLLAYLNATTPTGIPSGDTNIYTFGVPGDVLHPSFTLEDSYSKVNARVYADTLVQAVAFASNTHVYESFELTIDSASVNAQKMLGFQLNTNENISRTTAVVYCSAFASNTNQTSYLLSNNTGTSTDGHLPAPGIYNMNTTSCLYISLENTISQNRSTYYNMSKTDFMYRIPLVSTFGDNVTWQATIDTPSYQTNFNLTELRITVADQDGVNVNFQGSGWDADIKIDWAENADIPGVSAGDLTMHQVNQSTFDPRTVNQGYGAGYDRLFPEQGWSSQQSAKKRKPVPF